MDSNNKYTKMQQDHYDSHASKWNVENRDYVVGNFDKHNVWIDYNVYLFKNINTHDKIALDFGCGPGRGIVQFAHRFDRIDGIDISQNNLNNAKYWCELNAIKFTPHLYKSNGVDLSIIKSNTYDVVYSTICMQHICVHQIRFNLMKEFHRVLKNGGSICIQMGFGDLHPRGVKYHENHFDAPGTNGYQDVKVENVDDIKDDLNKIGFNHFEFDLRPVGPGDGGHTQWIFFRATK